jgi:hypothetical protein
LTTSTGKIAAPKIESATGPTAPATSVTTATPILTGRKFRVPRFTIKFVRGAVLVKVRNPNAQPPDAFIADGERIVVIAVQPLSLGIVFAGVAGLPQRSAGTHGTLLVSRGAIRIWPGRTEPLSIASVLYGTSV